MKKTLTWDLKRINLNNKYDSHGLSFNSRRPRRERPPSDEILEHLKSSSELNLAAASTSVPIRTTRASRLRAAAAHHSDTCSSPRKSNRSSSAQSLLDDSKTKVPKTSKIIERDKRTNRRQSNEGKSAATINDGAKSKSKHSIKLEKDKSNFMTSPKINDEKSSSKTNSNEGKAKDINIHVNGVEVFDEIIGDTSLDKIDDLFNDLVIGQSGVELKIGDTGLCGSHSFIAKVAVDNVKIESSVVPKVEDVRGLLGAVCVRKVERFSELLSNLCSPCEADVLFEDILVENGINGICDSVSVRTGYFTSRKE